MGGGGGCSLVTDISNTAPKAPPNTELAFFNPLIQLLTVFISDVVTPTKTGKAANTAKQLHDKTSAAFYYTQ